MPNGSTAAVKEETIRDCDKILMLQHLIQNAWEQVPPKGVDGDYWRGVICAIETVLEL